MNELVMKYLADGDMERAAFMHILTMAMLWNRDAISRIYDFKTERLLLDKIDEYLGYASSGEGRCLRLAVVLFNGGYHFEPDEINITELFRGLDQKRFACCMEAMEIRFEHHDRVYEKYFKKIDKKEKRKDINERQNE